MTAPIYSTPTGAIALSAATAPAAVNVRATMDISRI